jgi:hypothetical protein
MNTKKTIKEKILILSVFVLFLSFTIEVIGQNKIDILTDSILVNRKEIGLQSPNLWGLQIQNKLDSDQLEKTIEGYKPVDIK